jgi:O-acetyl-ADP-ribose deacetylase (regulator of RNase III)
MELILVDQSPIVAAALEHAFASHPEVRIATGDILEAADQSIVCPTNSYGYMDGGADAAIVDVLGLDIQVRVLAAIDHFAQGHLPVGSAILVESGNVRIPFLIVAPTMELPGPVRSTNVFFAMAATLALATRTPRIERVFCPGLGTGVGRVEPDVAAREMEAAYAKWLARRPDALDAGPGQA